MSNILTLTQGSPEWHEIRAKRFTASEAPAMMGASKYMTRDELLKQKATGIVPDVTDQQQRLFDRGHKAEEMARTIAESIIGEELFPATLEYADKRLLASMDGLTMLGVVGWEHKLFGEKLAAQVKSGELEDHYKWQMDQQMLVSGADSILFMTSDGTETNCCWVWYERDEDRIKRLLAGWEQFEKDLAAYEAPEPEAPKAEGAAPESLPTLRIELSGAVSATNLPEFKERALAIIGGIKTELVDDQDFADADKATKFLKKGEEQLEQAKARALEQTASIDELFKTVDELKDAMRTKRLALEKLVKAEKENRKLAILNESRQAIISHIAELEKGMEAQANCAVRMPNIDADFAGAMKGKKTIASLQSAANDTLAAAKIEANRVADVMRANIAVLNEHVEYGFLFNDYQQLLTKAADDFQAVVKSRIAEHKEAEAKRLEAERERIRKEEAEKVELERRQAEEREKQPEVAQAKPVEPQPDLLNGQPEKPVRSKFVISNDQVFNVAVNAVASHFQVTPAEAVDLLDAIDFSERAAS